MPLCVRRTLPGRLARGAEGPILVAQEPSSAAHPGSVPPGSCDQLPGRPVAARALVRAPLWFRMAVAHQGGTAFVAAVFARWPDPVEVDADKRAAFGAW